MASGTIKKPPVTVYTEKVALTFSNGAAFVNLNSNYYLVSAVVVDRPSSETDTYAILDIYGRTDVYRLQNKLATLSAQVNAVLTWVAK